MPKSNFYAIDHGNGDRLETDRRNFDTEWVEHTYLVRNGERTLLWTNRGPRLLKDSSFEEAMEKILEAASAEDEQLVAEFCDIFKPTSWYGQPTFTRRTDACD